MVNVSSGLNNLQLKVDNLDVSMLKTVAVDLKYLRYVVSKEIVKNAMYNKLNT